MSGITLLGQLSLFGLWNAAIVKSILKLQPKDEWIAVDNKEMLRNIAPSGVQPRADTVPRDAGRNSKKMKMPGKCEGPKWMCM